MSECLTDRYARPSDGLGQKGLEGSRRSIDRKVVLLTVRLSVSVGSGRVT